MLTLTFRFRDSHCSFLVFRYLKIMDNNHFEESIIVFQISIEDQIFIINVSFRFLVVFVVVIREFLYEQFFLFLVPRFFP